MTDPLPPTVPVDQPAARLAALDLLEWVVAVDAARTAALLLEAGWSPGDDDLAGYRRWLAGRLEDAVELGWRWALLTSGAGQP